MAELTKAEQDRIEADKAADGCSGCCLGAFIWPMFIGVTGGMLLEGNFSGEAIIGWLFLGGLSLLCLWGWKRGSSVS